MAPPAEADPDRGGRPGAREGPGPSSLSNAGHRAVSPASPAELRPGPVPSLAGPARVVAAKLRVRVAPVPRRRQGIDDLAGRPGIPGEGRTGRRGGRPGRGRGRPRAAEVRPDPGAGPVLVGPG